MCIGVFVSTACRKNCCIAACETKIGAFGVCILIFYLVECLGALVCCCEAGCCLFILLELFSGMIEMGWWALVTLLCG